MHNILFDIFLPILKVLKGRGWIMSMCLFAMIGIVEMVALQRRCVMIFMPDIYLEPGFQNTMRILKN